MPVRAFVDKYFRHFNASAVAEAAQGYVDLLAADGKMFVTLAGAMSTAELGVSLAQMIRCGYVSAISCTGANLEEDIFYAVASSKYRRLPDYRDLTPDGEAALLAEGMNRVTDTCIPEVEAMRKVEKHITPRWREAAEKGVSRLPHEYVYDIALDPSFRSEFENPAANSWVVAAAEHDIPLFVPGWEDSTLGNFFVSQVIEGRLSMSSIQSGLHYMQNLVSWYKRTSAAHQVGFFQIGGGIAGDFPICVVPLIHQDLREDVPLWSYFCQISDAEESYGGYSGAMANEKITWGKLAPSTPKYVIHSDATIVAPLIFSYVLDE